MMFSLRINWLRLRSMALPQRTPWPYPTVPLPKKLRLHLTVPLPKMSWPHPAASLPGTPRLHLAVPLQGTPQLHPAVPQAPSRPPEPPGRRRVPPQGAGRPPSIFHVRKRTGCVFHVPISIFHDFSYNLPSFLKPAGRRMPGGFRCCRH